VAGVVGDDGEIRGLLLNERVDEVDRQPSRTKAADQNRSAVLDAGESLFRRLHDFVDHQSKLQSLNPTQRRRERRDRRETRSRPTYALDERWIPACITCA